MIIVTSGYRYLDIDAYACCIAYAELLTLLGKPAKAVSTAPLNESITPSLRTLPVEIENTYSPSMEDRYVLVDISEPAYFDSFVREDQITEIYDHHPGLEEYWQKRLHDRSHIDFIGAAATLIVEAWQKAGQLEHMSPASATLLASAILDNTLNFGADVTTKRDKDAYESVRQHASLSHKWPAHYFSECQQTTIDNLAQALKNDTKEMKFSGIGDELRVGQIVVWNASTLIKNELPTIIKVLRAMHAPWFANIVSISEGCSYFLAQDIHVKQWLQQLLTVTFSDDIAKASRLWLRKEIMKADQNK